MSKNHLKTVKNIEQPSKKSKVSKNRQKCRNTVKNVKKPSKTVENNVKKSPKNVKNVEKILKPSKISKNREKTVKIVEKPSENHQECRKTI